jgi:hypothetical protein
VESLLSKRKALSSNPSNIKKKKKRRKKKEYSGSRCRIHFYITKMKVKCIPKHKGRKLTTILPRFLYFTTSLNQLTAF